MTPSKALDAPVRAAERYTTPKDLWVVSTFFDSEGYASKLRALRAYLRTMDRSDIPLVLVEGAFGKRPFLLRESDRVIHVQCPSILWQKERLLNVAIENLPSSCRKVAWLDADVFFENPDWAVETSAALDRHPIVQPFNAALWLPKGTTSFRGRGIAWSSFAATSQNHPGLFLSGDFDHHGHSGYAWAARRELVARHGLYDRSIVGSGDHLMAHVMMGDMWSPCVTNSIGAETAFRASLEAWARPFHADVKSDVGYVPGALLHRWHGDRRKRRYYKRMVGLLARQYDPARDVRQTPSGALEWTEQGAELGRWMKDYFAGRKEDGKPGKVETVPASELEAIRRPTVSELDRALLSRSPLLGPLATRVSETAEDWEDLGLTPVLPHLFAELVTGAPASMAALAPTSTRNHHSSRAGTILLTRATAAAAVAPSQDASTLAKDIVDRILDRARSLSSFDSGVWRHVNSNARWAMLAASGSAPSQTLVDELAKRVRDPRSEEAPELRTAKVQLMRRRARRSRQGATRIYPFDAAVGPGATASGLDHV